MFSQASVILFTGGEGGSVSACTTGHMTGGLCRGGLYPEGSLSREVSVQGESLSGGVSVGGVSVQGVLCLGGLCPGGLCLQYASYWNAFLLNFNIPCGFQVLYESAICNDYLDEVYPEHPLNPKNPFVKAKQRILLERWGKVMIWLFKPPVIKRRFFFDNFPFIAYKEFWKKWQKLAEHLALSTCFVDLLLYLLCLTSDKVFKPRRLGVKWKRGGVSDWTYFTKLIMSSVGSRIS